MKYDVFISCKSEDYNIGRQVYEFLTNYRGLSISVFMADKELRKRGNTDYGRVIDEALDSSTHLIIVSSNADYLKEETSSYVYEEWHTFVEEIRSGRKKGNIMTIFTNDVDLKDVPIALRNRQSFPFTEYSSIVHYLKVEDEVHTNAPVSKEVITKESDFDELEIDLDFDDAVDFMNDGDLQDAIHSLQSSFENGNKKSIGLFNKILFQNFGAIEWDSETWDFMEEQAKAGHSFAHLAFFYKLQLNKETHLQAVEQLKAALSDKDNGYAFLCEGICREKGIGMRSNLRSAMKRYEQAYKMNIPEASSYIGKMYLYGNSGIEIDKQKGIEILTHGVESGDALSCLFLGEYYAGQENQNNNKELAIDYLKKAIELHHYEAWISLGKLYQNDIYTEKRYDKAKHCYQEAVKCGIRDGHAYIARLDWKQEYFEDAILEVQKGVRLNNVLCISTLGSFYEEGIPDDSVILHEPDYQRAWECYQKAFNMGARIEDAVSMARLFVKKEFCPPEISWEIIEGYLKQGAQIPIIEAIELMVEALKQNGKEVEALKYIKMGADTGSLSMMYEYGARTLSASHGDALHYLEESGKKGYVPAIERLMTYYGDRHLHSDIEYGKWLEIAIQYGVEIPIDDYSIHLYNNYRFDDLFKFLKSRFSDEEPYTLLLMAKYFPLLPFNEDDIKWLLEKLAVHYRYLVTRDPIIYDYYADLLIKCGTEEEYVRYAEEVGQIDDYRGEYLMIRRSIRLQSLKDYKTQINENLNTVAIRREWAQRFQALGLIAETLKKKVLIINNASSSTAVIKKCLEYEQFEVLIFNPEDITSDIVKQTCADLIILNLNPASSEGEILIRQLKDINPYNLLVTDSFQQKEHVDGVETLSVPFDIEYLLLAVRRTISFAKKNVIGKGFNKEKRTIVIVDDKETIAKVLGLYLMSDYNVIWLPDGLEASKWVQSKGSPDLMIVDIRMPGMRGDDFLEWIKQNKQFKHVPIIMLSSEDSKQERLRLMDIGAEDYIVKPFNPMDLKIRVEKILLS